ncbi:MAG TPA: dihydropteroate synthase [Rhizomicrobium sp.]|nr:dihydropteroate synthase [Rhizomicrobium sp.]
MKILGILNITEDSFSDGGKFLAPEAARAHGLALLEEGADILDIGAASSNPDAKRISPETEIARLKSVLPVFRQHGAIISIDSFSLPVQRWALTEGVAYLNDIHGFAEPSIYPELAQARAKLIVMHAIQNEGAATRADVPASEIFARAVSFFERRLAALAKAGIAADRLILDPGMGFFVGSDPENSLTLLRRLPDLKARFDLPILVSVSRKSFLRKITGQSDPAGLPVLAGGLAAELYAIFQGADYLRTHAPGALTAALKTRFAIGGKGFLPKPGLD